MGYIYYYGALLGLRTEMGREGHLAHLNIQVETDPYRTVICHGLHDAMNSVGKIPAQSLKSEPKLSKPVLEVSTQNR